MKKEKTPLLVFYRNGEDGSIGVEFSNHTNHSVQIEQQLIGAVECYLQNMKEEIIERINYSDDEKVGDFT